MWSSSLDWRPQWPRARGRGGCKALSTQHREFRLHPRVTGTQGTGSGTWDPTARVLRLMLHLPPSRPGGAPHCPTPSSYTACAHAHTQKQTGAGIPCFPQRFIASCPRLWLLPPLLFSLAGRPVLVWLQPRPRGAGRDRPGLHTQHRLLAQRSAAEPAPRACRGHSSLFGRRRRRARLRLLRRSRGRAALRISVGVPAAFRTVWRRCRRGRRRRRSYY